jgi:hypothetical protein
MEIYHKILVRLNQALMVQHFTRNASRDMKAFSVEHVIQVFLSKIIHMQIVFRVKTNLTFQNTLAEL